MGEKMADNFQSKSLSLKEVSKVYHSNIIKMKTKQNKKVSQMEARQGMKIKTTITHHLCDLLKAYYIPVLHSVYTMIYLTIKCIHTHKQ